MTLLSNHNVLMLNKPPPHLISEHTALPLLYRIANPRPHCIYEPYKLFVTIKYLP